MNWCAVNTAATPTSVIRGIGIVTCIYVNPEVNQFWLLDYRIFAPAEDGKTKLDHAKQMFDLVLDNKQLPVRCVLMDTWYATRQFMRSRGGFSTKIHLATDALGNTLRFLPTGGERNDITQP